mgnify:CR=1 FL=1
MGAATLRLRLSYLRLFVILHFAFCFLVFAFCFACSVRALPVRFAFSASAPFPRNFCRFAFFSDLGVYRRPRIPSFPLPGSRFHSRVATGLAPYEALLSRQERECHPKRQKPRRPVFCIHYFKFRNSYVRISLRGEAFLLSPQCRTRPPAHSLLRSTSAPSSSRRA